MFYKNWLTRFLLRKDFLSRVRMRLQLERRKLIKSEFDDLKFLYRMLNRDPKVIFDCGANIGLVSFEFGKCFPKARIYSFEPNPDVFQKLSLSLEQEENIHPRNLGVGSREGSITFYKNNNTGTSSFLQPNEFHRAHMARKYTTISVPVITIQRICDEEKITEISILKLDIEGYELEALEGCRELLKSQRVDCLFIEVSFVPTYNGQPLIEDIITYLRRFEYIPYNMYGINETSMRESILTNILFISKAVAGELVVIHGPNSVYAP